MKLFLRSLGLWYLASLLRVCWRINSSTAYPEIFGDYESYHEAKETGDGERAVAIGHLIERRSRVADIGCGNGQIASYLQDQRECDVVGVDVSRTAAAKARRLGIEVSVQDVNAGLRLPCPVDYVVLSEVIEHLQTPQKVLVDSADQARRGVVVTIPNSGWLPWRIQFLRGYWPRQSFTHLHFWTHADFVLFCRQLGLRIARFSPVVPRGMIGGWLVRHFPNVFAYQLCYLVRR